MTDAPFENLARGSSAEAGNPDSPADDPTDSPTDSPAGNPDSPAKSPENWATGDEPATAPQRSYLETLARDTGADVPDDLTKGQASELIDKLRNESPRVEE